MRKTKTIHSESVPHAMHPVARGVVASGVLDVDRSIEGSLVVECTAATPVLDLATFQVLELLKDGAISLMGATHRLGLADAGHMLSLMREHGVRPYQHSNLAALELAKKAVIGERHAKPAKVDDRLITRS